MYYVTLFKKIIYSEPQVFFFWIFFAKYKQRLRLNQLKLLLLSYITCYKYL